MNPGLSGIYPCADGYIGLITVTQEKWIALCEWMGKPELVEDPRFKTGEARTANIKDLDAVLGSWVKDQKAEDLLREGQKRRLPFGIPMSTQKLLVSRHLNERRYFVEVDHPVTGKIRYPGRQLQIGDLPYQLKRAPLLGEHNQEIYRGRMGFPDDDLIRMKTEGII